MIYLILNSVFDIFISNLGNFKLFLQLNCILLFDIKSAVESLFLSDKKNIYYSYQFYKA